VLFWAGFSKDLEVRRLTQTQQPGGGAEMIALLEHLCHEIRQPLGELETTAFYLGMMAGSVDPALYGRTEHLRLLVRQASWLVSDAAHFHPGEPSGAGPADLNALVEEVCAYCAQHEDFAPRFNAHVAPLPVTLAGDVFTRLLRHVLAFLRDVARCAAPPVLETMLDQGRPGLAIRAEIRRPAAEMAALLDPPGVSGGFRRCAAILGFEPGVSGAAGALRVEMKFPVAQYEADERGVTDFVQPPGAGG
jgi:hypothetical protein